ncbi:hypothetical protein [Candidatus Chlamydia corallus]|uniref:hypothetical protein n=1 Tax=Candidatus Chlamydia corallus TaxID=2038470 RepID=UPI001EFD8D60|nr:hypothetical protein [Candidatus Chlamydia corallus]
MVCPSWLSHFQNCNCQWTEVTTEEAFEMTQNTGGTDEEPSTSGTSPSGKTPPITSQPGKIKKVEKHFQFSTGNEDSTLQTIRDAGELLDSVISHRRTQRCSAFCYDTCSSGCERHCGSFGRFICGIYNACCLDEDNSFVDFIQECEANYGPIAVALAAKNDQYNLMELAENNTKFTEEEKNEFRQKCEESKSQLYGTMLNLTQSFFFEGVGSIQQRAPNDPLIETMLQFIAGKSWETILKEEGAGASSSPQQSPNCYILSISPLTTQPRPSCLPKDARRPSYATAYGKGGGSI